MGREEFDKWQKQLGVTFAKPSPETEYTGSPFERAIMARLDKIEAMLRTMTTPTTSGIIAGPTFAEMMKGLKDCADAHGIPSGMMGTPSGALYASKWTPEALMDTPSIFIENINDPACVDAAFADAPTVISQGE